MDNAANTPTGGEDILKFKRRRFFLICAAALILTAGIAVYALTSGGDTGGGDKLGAETTAAQTTPLITSAQESTAAPILTSAPESTTPPQTTDPPKYDYSFAVPSGAAVEDSYFDDAVFIGDSRTEGFIMNSGLSNTVSYTYKGLTVDTVYTSAVINMDGEKISVMDALKKTSFAKVYVMLGINETGWPSSSIFIEKFEKIIDDIHAVNPDAVIYVQAILPVSAAVSAEHSYLKNSKIFEYNRLLLEMSYKKKVCFVDSAEAVAAPDGSLPEDGAPDGIHPNKTYCQKWLEYLKTHTKPEGI